MGLGVDSASKTNECRDYVLVVNTAGS